MSIKSKIIDKVSDVMSFRARRAAQKSALKADKDVAAIKAARPKRVVQIEVLKKKPEISQRDAYNKAMKSAGPSSGIGVGP
jgi:hypothetical protein